MERNGTVVLNRKQTLAPFELSDYRLQILLRRMQVLSLINHTGPVHLRSLYRLAGTIRYK